MPLLDHFHPPLSVERRWEAFHSSWATRIVDALTDDLLPPGYIAEEHVHFGPSVEIDVATFARATDPVPATNGTVATLAPRVWAPPAADGVVPAVFVDTFAVRVFSTETGPRLVAAIELVSPRNKDRDDSRRAFAIKVASYLVQGISVIVVDIVTSRLANLHHEILTLIRQSETLRLPDDAALYAVAYRPVQRGGSDGIDVWRSVLALGEPLPTLPLALNAELVLPIDFEATYAEAVLRRRLTAD